MNNGKLEKTAWVLHNFSPNITRMIKQRRIRQPDMWHTLESSVYTVLTEEDERTRI
jgi:hypothetical protein